LNPWNPQKLEHCEVLNDWLLYGQKKKQSTKGNRLQYFRFNQSTKWTGCERFECQFWCATCAASANMHTKPIGECLLWTASQH